MKRPDQVVQLQACRRFLGTDAALLAALPLHRAGAADEPPKPTADARLKSRLIPLGAAGGPTPKPTRAASAQVICVNGVTQVIDCGNGVARQRVMAKLRPGSIRSVFLTHQHADHNADYGKLLWPSWASDLARRVDAYGPPPLSEMTRQLLAPNDHDIRRRMADEGRAPRKDLIAAHEITTGGVVMQDENAKLIAARVEHLPVEPAFAFRFDCPERSIVISDDTRPSKNPVKLAQGADVLVHDLMYLPLLEHLIATEPNAENLREHLLASHITTEQVGRSATEAGVDAGAVALRSGRLPVPRGRGLGRCRAPTLLGQADHRARPDRDPALRPKVRLPAHGPAQIRRRPPLSNFTEH